MNTKAFMITDKANEIEGIVSEVDADTIQINWTDERVDQLTNEELESLLEDDNYTVEEVELKEETPPVGPNPSATPAQASIKAHSSADKAPGQEDDGNPKTRIDWIRAVLGDLACASEESIEAAHFAMQQAQIGGSPEHANDGKVDGNRSTITMKPSAAVGHGFLKTEQDALFGETGLTEDAQLKISTLFETAVLAAVTEETAKLQEQYDVAINEAIVEMSSGLEEKVGTFLDLVVEEWLTNNKVAIESRLRTELTMQFLDKLHTLFEENYIDVPEDKVDVVEAFVEKNKELEDKINSKMNENIELGKKIKLLEKTVEVNKLSEGLTLPKKTQLAKLIETVEFTNAEEFGKKVAVIKEGFLKDKASGDTGILTETGPVDDTKVVVEEKPVVKSSVDKLLAGL